MSAPTKEMLVTVVAGSFMPVTLVTPTPPQAHRILVSTAETSLNPSRKIPVTPTASSPSPVAPAALDSPPCVGSSQKSSEIPKVGD